VTAEDRLELVRQHLYILRAQVELGIAQLEAGGPASPAAAAGGVCPHPDEKRYDATTAGDSGSKWICGDCLQTFEGAIP
jgi:hypothetical protein